MEQKYRVGEEVEVSFIGTVIEARIVETGALQGEPIKKVKYTVESETARAIVEEAHIIPVPTPDNMCNNGSVR